MNLLRILLLSACCWCAAAPAPASAANPPAKTPRVADPRGIAGPWEGQWESRKNGHKGELRCVVEPVKDGKYLFRYRASWGKLMAGNFQITCEVTPSGSGYAVSGSKNLLIFGTYHHEGRISPRAFEATFRSERKDLGSFHLKRPAGWKP